MLISIKYWQSQQYSRTMKLVLVLVILVIYLGGYYTIKRHPYFKEDPMLTMNQITAPILQELIETKFFRIIRLNMNQDCLLGHRNKICKQKTCTVCRCDEKDIPLFWTKTDPVASKTKDKDLWARERQKEGKEWVWHVQDQANDEGEYFDVVTNVQSFTNYNGSYIWKLIYSENCFKPISGEQMCAEEQTLYQIISGLHTSISTHITRFYRHFKNKHVISPISPVDDDPAFFFNHTEYAFRVLQFPDRIRNLVFLYRILAKAVKEAAPYLRHSLNIASDNITEDLKSKQLLDGLLKQIQGYELSDQEKEVLRFFTADNPKVKQIQRYIHNISSIMDCIECEKCRLFGKMQTYGIGTALKILLGYPTPYKRNEIVALFNVFNKITMSVETYYKYRTEAIEFGFESPSPKYLQWYLYFGGFITVCLVSWCIYTREDQKLSNKEKEQ